MMKTPIYDFVCQYAEKNALRLHMPGHKGKNLLGFEKFDITEINGADSLYEADGIINESEKNAGELFGCKTLYSTEGSSLCIRAMLYLVCLYAKEKNEKPLIFAGRNAHKSFLSAAVLLDFDVEWLYPEKGQTYLSCNITPEKLRESFMKTDRKPTAVYVTSPDYLGNTIDIKAISHICKENGVLLIVDNAHGAYLRFLPESLHPIDAGADMCCDSAHKTLPVLTGGAYLHINRIAPSLFAENAKNALALFGSTSPSYLILQSLDIANRYLAEKFRDDLKSFAKKIENLKINLKSNGYILIEKEPLKITIDAKSYGYYGNDFAEKLSSSGIEYEFCDKDFVVMMFTPALNDEEINQIEKTLLKIAKRDKINEIPPEIPHPEKVMSIREAAMSCNQVLPVEKCCGKVLALSSVGCPPAVSVIAGGEKIDEDVIKNLQYYSAKNCIIIKK